MSDVFKMFVLIIVGGALGVTFLVMADFFGRLLLGMMAGFALHAAATWNTISRQDN